MLLSLHATSPCNDKCCHLLLSNDAIVAWYLPCPHVLDCLLFLLGYCCNSSAAPTACSTAYRTILAAPLQVHLAAWYAHLHYLPVPMAVGAGMLHLYASGPFPSSDRLLPEPIHILGLVVSTPLQDNAFVHSQLKAGHTHQRYMLQS